MAQSGFSPIQLYRSATLSAVPAAGNLVFGELALNYRDGNLFFKDSSNVVRLLASTAAATGTVSSVQASGGTTGLTFTGGPITTSGTLTLGGTLGVANGGTGAGDAAAARTNLGAGTVSSVQVSGGTTGLTATGGPITTSGTLTLGGTLAVANGGTGATAAPTARTNLGATTLGANIFTITNPSAITFPRFNADNTVSALDAAAFRTAIGVGTGTGTVTSVQVSGGTTGLTATGGPITSSGTITLGGTLAVANGGTGVTSSTGTNAVVLNTNPTLSGAVLTSPTLGGTAGNNSIPLATSVPNTLNAQQVRLVEERVSAGTDWTTTRSRLYTRIDATDHTYIDLRTDTATPAIAFGTGAAGNPVERMRITQAGLVGIGTASPLSLLHVAGVGRFGPSSGTGGVAAIYSDGNNVTIEAFQADTPATKRNIGLATYGGNVGIGTTNPGVRLDVVGNALNPAVQNTYAFWVANSGGANGDLAMGSNASAAFLQSFGAKPLAINSEGNAVGIGTAAPASVLHVNRAGATDCRVTVGNATAAIQTGVEPGGVGFLFNNQNFALTFGTNGVERARISAGGDVGLSTTNPQARLHVAGGDIRLDNTFSLTFRNPANTGNATFTYQGDDNFVAYNAANVPIWNFTGGASPNASYGCSANTRAIFDASTNNINFRTNGTDKLIINVDGDITSSNRAAAVGFKGVPPSGITSGTITTADIGRCVPATAGVTAPSGTFARGDTITIYNDSASAITITQGAGLTLRLAGTTTTGNRTLAARGMATLWYNSASEAIASGPGLT